MKNIFTFVFACALLLGFGTGLEAGNKDRVGQAGASELLINPWARSSGMHGAHTAGVRGIEAMRFNVAGLAFVNKTDIQFARTEWLRGSGVNVSAFGFAQRMGETSVLGVNVMALGMGEIPITTVDQPDADGGATYKPQFIQLGIGYGRSFSESIHGGFVLRVINEAIADVRASGVAVDAGLQYVTGPRKQVKFGISLRNVGTPMRMSGDGLTVKLADEQNNVNANQRAEKFELPSLLNIGASYDFLFADHHRLTVAGNFTSNSFRNDFLGAGLEYGFNEKFMLRAGYRYEDENLDDELSIYTYNGLAFGATIDVPIKKDGPRFGIDYSYRTTRWYEGTHTIGVRISLAGGGDEE